jgi:hypothetical protein
MKKLIYTAFVICGMLTASCSDLLNLESKTDVTNNYLFTTPEGLNTAVTGLYSLARELPGGAGRQIARGACGAATGDLIELNLWIRR